MSERTVVQVGQHQVILGRPPSVASIYDVVTAAAKNELRGLAAALGLCWEAGGSKAAPAKWSTCGCDALVYGGRVIDQLAARGIPLEDWTDAASRAFLELAERLPKKKAVEELEDFTGPGEAP